MGLKRKGLLQKVVFCSFPEKRVNDLKHTQFCDKSANPLSALREKQLEKEEEERILEENWSKVHESLKRVRNLQDEIDGEPLSPFVFSICITSDARPDSAQYANQNRVLDDNVYKAIKIQNKYSSKVKGKIRKAWSKKMRRL